MLCKFCYGHGYKHDRSYEMVDGGRSLLRGENKTRLAAVLKLSGYGLRELDKRAALEVWKQCKYKAKRFASKE